MFSNQSKQILQLIPVPHREMKIKHSLLLGLGLLFLGSSILHLQTGYAPLVLWDGLQAAEVELLRSLRLPRYLSVAMVGAMLAVSGGIFQGLFRNPLAEPSLLGISSGAALMTAMGMLLPLGFFAMYWGQSLLAFLGALFTGGAVIVLGRTEGKIRVDIMLLAGVAISSLTAAALALITILLPDQQLRSLMYWTLGSFNLISMEESLALVPFFGLAMVLAFLPGKHLNALVLGEEQAALLGLRIERFKIGMVVLVTLCMGATVALAGIIGFVGLFVPHLFRLMGLHDYRVLLPLASLGGAVFLLFSDVLAKGLFAPLELPIGVITSFIGVPFFFFVLYQFKRQRL